MLILFSIEEFKLLDKLDYDTNMQFIHTRFSRLNLSSLMSIAVKVSDVWSQSLALDLHSAVFSLEINLDQFFVRTGSISVFPFETSLFWFDG